MEAVNLNRYMLFQMIAKSAVWRLPLYRTLHSNTDSIYSAAPAVCWQVPVLHMLSPLICLHVSALIIFDKFKDHIYFTALYYLRF
jgi:hypothetical protein